MEEKDERSLQNSFPSEEIEQILGYSFADKTLLKRCFTLSSLSKSNNERLEFLGDAVIELAVSDELYRRCDLGEGEMTVLRQKYVSNANLKKVVERLQLNRFLRYEGTQVNVGNKPVASLFEALTGGVYLDGGAENARAFIDRHLFFGVDLLSDVEREKSGDSQNYKGKLQEYLQGVSHEKTKIEYTLLKKTGPDHCPWFKVRVSGGERIAEGEGSSKNAAQQQAAKNLLDLLLQSEKNKI